MAKRPPGRTPCQPGRGRHGAGRPPRGTCQLDPKLREGVRGWGAGQPGQRRGDSLCGGERSLPRALVSTASPCSTGPRRLSLRAASSSSARVGTLPVACERAPRSALYSRRPGRAGGGLGPPSARPFPASPGAPRPRPSPPPASQPCGAPRGAAPLTWPWPPPPPPPALASHLPARLPCPGPPGPPPPGPSARQRLGHPPAGPSSPVTASTLWVKPRVGRTPAALRSPPPFPRRAVRRCGRQPCRPADRRGGPRRRGPAVRWPGTAGAGSWRAAPREDTRGRTGRVGRVPKGSSPARATKEALAIPSTQWATERCMLGIVVRGLEACA